MAEQDALILGALLHDIGKSEFRANRDYTSHPNYGDYFVGEHLASFRCLDDMREDIRRVVAFHHYAELADPSVQNADHISAGSERTPDTSAQTRRPLTSILAGIDIDKGKLPDGVFCYPPGPIDPDNPFPQVIPNAAISTWRPDEEEMIRLHKAAWDAFVADVRKMPDLSGRALIETLQAVLEKHTARVSSAGYKSIPDICLYDHSRSVAAIASCLETAGHDAEKPFLAIQGDVSGIQKFLYKLAEPAEGGTKNTAKRLRGRSFYVWLLTESVATRYLRTLDLYRTNLIFSGGGHFLILAPNTEANQKACANLEREVNQRLYGKLRGDLGLVTATDAFSREEIKQFADMLTHMGGKLAVEKRRKFRSAFDESFFAPKGYDKKMDVCSLCQADFVKGSGDFCPDCISHVELGRQIVSAQWLIRIEGTHVKAHNLFRDFEYLGICWALREDVDAVYALLNELDSQAVTDVTVYRLNNADFLADKLVALVEEKGLRTSFGYRFLGNYAPRKGADIMEFGDLAAENSENYPLLGIVRMDVDSLGHVFGLGLKERKSLSRLSTLSREMDMFFLGYVNKLAREHHMYITYSGGDDLFAVGSWINAIVFAQAVRTDFRRFCCNNPNLSISGGIFLCKEHYPINRAAEQCANAEAAAKQKFPQEKDAVNAFGLTVHWTRSSGEHIGFDELLHFADILHALCAKNQLPRSLIHHLIDADVRSRKDDGKIDNAAFIRNQMRLKYLVARQGVTHKKIQENQERGEPDEKIKTLTRLVMDNDLMKHIRIPASCVLYKTRNTTRTE